MAHWQFSYVYYRLVRIIPYSIDFKVVPSKVVIWNSIQFWFWHVANILNTLFFSVFVYFVMEAKNVTHNMAGMHKAIEEKADTYYIDSFLKVVYALYMAYALYRVKTTIN